MQNNPQDSQTQTQWTPVSQVAQVAPITQFPQMTPVTQFPQMAPVTQFPQMPSLTQLPQISPLPSGSMSYSMVGQPTMLPPQLYPTSHIQLMTPVQDMNRGPRYHVPRITPSTLEDIPSEYRSMFAINHPPRSEEDLDGWFTYFSYEVAIHKQAMRRIIYDIMQFRHQHRVLVAANADLQTKIDNYDKKKKVLYEIFEGDKLDKEKIRDIFTRLNAKIVGQARELKIHETQMMSYEKELAKREELRTQYDALIKKSQTREAEVKAAKERINKAETLSDTVRYQERVIEKLQTMISDYMRQKRAEGTINDIDRTLLTEHAALGRETKHLLKQMPVERPVGVGISQQQDILRQTQARQRELEQQNFAFQKELEELNAEFEEKNQQWGREKADLLDKINAIDEPEISSHAQKH